MLMPAIDEPPVPLPVKAPVLVPVEVAPPPPPAPAPAPAKRQRPTPYKRKPEVVAPVPGARIAAIDGLRAVAVLALVGYHFDLGLGGGYLALDVFFVISGFVVTRQLLALSWVSRKVSFTDFWTTRAKRLFPGLLALLFAVQLWVHFATPSAEFRAATNAQTIASVGYVNNWMALYSNVFHPSSDGYHTPLAHLWSLAVQEQFFLVWPLVIALLLKSRHLRIAGIVLAFTAAAASYGGAFLLYQQFGVDRAYLGTDARIGAALLGAAVAFLLMPQRKLNRHRRHDGPRQRELTGSTVLGSIAIVALAVALVFAQFGSAQRYSGWFAACGLAAALLVASIAWCPTAPHARLLGLAPLRWIGERSYAIFLWHWPVTVLVTAESTGLSDWALAGTRTGATLVLAVLSYGLVENHYRQSQASGPALLAGLAIPAVAVVVSTLLFQPSAPKQWDDEVPIETVVQDSG